MAPHIHEPPVLTLVAAAEYVGRTPNAMKILRHRRRGPASFVQDGRLYYYRCCLDAWLAEGAASDSRFNPALDPTQGAPEPRRTKSAA